MLTKWIIDGRKKPWPTSELFVGYDSHESVRSGQKLRPRLVHASIARGIILTIRRSALILCRCVKSEKGEINERRNQI